MSLLGFLVRADLFIYLFIVPPIVYYIGDCYLLIYSISCKYVVFFQLFLQLFYNVVMDSSQFIAIDDTGALNHKLTHAIFLQVDLFLRDQNLRVAA